MKFLSVVVPAYNEEANITPLVQSLHDKLEKIGRPYEIIFVNDGSTDRTFEFLLEEKKKNKAIRIISFEKNSGQSAAFDAGFKASRGDIIITLDADLQNDPADISLLLERLNSCDAVVGLRLNRTETLLRRIAARLGNLVRSWLVGDKFHDTGCSFRAFKSHTLERIKLYHGLHRYVPSLLAMEGFDVEEIPVRHYPRTRGKSKYGILNRIFKVASELIILWWMKKRTLKYKISREV